MTDTIPGRWQASKPNDNMWVGQSSSSSGRRPPISSSIPSEQPRMNHSREQNIEKEFIKFVETDVQEDTAVSGGISINYLQERARE